MKISSKSGSRTVVAAVSIGIFALAPAASGSLMYHLPMGVFENASGVDTQGLNLGVQLKDGGAYIDFTFLNESTTPSVITNIYFENADLITGGLINPAIIPAESSEGVSFSTKVSPKNPPGSISHVGGNWGGNLWAIGANAPGPHNGIGLGELLTIRFYYNDIIFDDVISAFHAPGGFRLAQHVQGMNQGASVWTVSTPVPLPSAIWLMGLPVVAMGILRARRPLWW